MAIDWATIAVPAAGTAVSALFDKLGSQNTRQIMEEVLEGMNQRRMDLERRKRGQFTPREREEIERASEPVLDQVAGGVASRLGAHSAAGAKIVSQAQQRPYERAMREADEELERVEMNVYSMAREMATTDESFASDIQGLMKNYFYLREMGKQDDFMEEMLNKLDEVDAWDDDFLDDVYDVWDQGVKALGQ